MNLPTKKQKTKKKIVCPIDSKKPIVVRLKVKKAHNCQWRFALVRSCGKSFYCIWKRRKLGDERIRGAELRK